MIHKFKYQICKFSYAFGMHFKEILKNELEYQGILVKELSEKSGIKKQTLDNYLSTHSCIPHADIAVKIASALNVSVEYLMTGKETKSSASDFSIEEKKLISAFRNLPEQKKKALLQLIC